MGKNSFLKLVEDSELEKPVVKRKRGRSENQNHNSVQPKNPSGFSFSKNVKPKTSGQAILIESLNKNEMVFALGVAGTGKTYLAVNYAIKMLNEGKKIILSRPAVEAGERLGFLPGDMKEKVDPYMRPIYDILKERISPEKLKQLMLEEKIEIAPLAFLRGRTFNNAVVILDEAQNATYMQLKMFVTRMGFGSQIILTGDPEQSDLPQGQSGLENIVSQLEKNNISGVDIVRLKAGDVVRHRIVKEMLKFLN